MGSKNKKARKKKHRTEIDDVLFESDDTFAFIVGYTSGGFAYGITWEEMEEIERRDNADFEKSKTKHCNENIDLPF